MDGWLAFSSLVCRIGNGPYRSPMSEPLTAGEKLAPSRPRTTARAAGGNRHRLASDAAACSVASCAAWWAGCSPSACWWLAVGGVGGYVAWERFSADLPDVDGLRNYQPPVMSRVYAGDARLMTELATERRIFVPFSAVPEMVKQAFVSAEDQNFWTHPGVDPLAIARAAVFDLTHMGQGRRPVGASTITQQVAKNMLLDNQVSLARKAREAILAMRIEQNLPKERILELYLNEIYLGLCVVRRRRGGAGLLQQAARQADAVRGGVPGRAAEGAEQLQSVQVSRRRARRGATGCWTGWPRTTSITADAGRRREGRADHAVGIPPTAADPRRRLVRRGGAPPTDRAVRRRRDDAGRADGAHQPRSGAADSPPSKALRDGLMAYDRKMGGWRGPVGASRRRTGAGEELGRSRWRRWRGRRACCRTWKLAVVLETTDSEARLGWLDTSGRLAAAAHRHAAACPISPGRGRCRDGKPGPAPRRMADVMQQGDVVMVEPDARCRRPPPPPRQERQAGTRRHCRA